MRSYISLYSVGISIFGNDDIVLLYKYIIGTYKKNNVIHYYIHNNEIFL